MSAQSITHRCTTLVLGSGVAGLTYALRAAQHGPVLILTKKSQSDSSTNRAQGGLAAVLGPTDSFDLHVADTLEAGAGLCRRDVVELVVREGPALVRSLTELGATFQHEADDSDGFDLGLEGGHSRRRIVHSKDRTGQEIESTLLAAVAGFGEGLKECRQLQQLTLYLSSNQIGDTGTSGLRQLKQCLRANVMLEI